MAGTAREIGHHSCCQQKQAGTSFKSPIYFGQRVPRLGQAVLALSKRATLAFLEQQLPYTRTSSPW